MGKRAQTTRLLIDTNVFIDHLRGALDLGPLFSAGHKYSFVTAKELLGLGSGGRLTAGPSRHAGTMAAGVGDRELLRYLRYTSRLPYFVSFRHYGYPVNRDWERTFKRELKLLSWFECVPVSRSVRIEAEQLVKSGDVESSRTNDAVIELTAVKLGLPVLSGDAGFDRLGSVRVGPEFLVIPRQEGRRLT